MSRHQRVLPSVIFLLAFCVTVFSPLYVAAQLVDREKFQAFLASDLHDQPLDNALSTVSKIAAACPTLRTMRGRVTPRTPITFGPDGVPISGSWLEKFPVERCSYNTILNVFFFMGSNGRPTSILGLPGTTGADLTLQRDGLRCAFAGAGSRVKDCKQFEVTNTRFEAFGRLNTPDPGAADRFRPWWETWTVAACGYVFDIPIEFVPGQAGTQIIQNIANVKQR